mmetsp:Transcript_10969/g.50671  ORF Transcript_10969/g.50671 Transcript_10969/m.50671 type:complete len:254 (+) Transcript_10969:2387-3148(+)
MSSERIDPIRSAPEACPHAVASAATADSMCAADPSRAPISPPPARIARAHSRLPRDRHVAGFSLAHVDTSSHSWIRSLVSADPEIERSSSASSTSSQFERSLPCSSRSSIASLAAPERHPARTASAPTRPAVSLKLEPRNLSSSGPIQSPGRTNLPTILQHSLTSRTTASSLLAEMNASQRWLTCCNALSSRNTSMVRSSTAALALNSICQLDISPITGLTTDLKLFLMRMRDPSRGRLVNGGGRVSASSPTP